MLDAFSLPVGHFKVPNNRGLGMRKEGESRMGSSDGGGLSRSQLLKTNDFSCDVADRYGSLREAVRSGRPLELSFSFGM